MYSIDFLAVENTDGDSTRSGDAIVVQYTTPLGATKTVVIDAGFDGTGDQVVTHVRDVLGQSHVDLVVSTHPDSDHLNGLVTVLEELTVGELIIHVPDMHQNATKMSNRAKFVEVIRTAQDRGIKITEPFTGHTYLDGTITVLGPDRDYYETLLADFASGTSSASESRSFTGTLAKLATRVLDKVLTYFPVETLGDDDDDSSRNQSSVILLLEADGKRVMFTGDAGIEALTRASNYYESIRGLFSVAPLTFFQPPHHGSKHNLGPTILDRILGRIGAPHGSTIAYISSSKTSEKHPSPKVTNALGRRNVPTYVTEGQSIWWHSPGMTRPRYTVALKALPPLDEDDN